MLYIFHGEDDLTRREALACLAESLDVPEALATNTSKLDGSDLSYEQLMSIINANTLPSRASAGYRAGPAQQIEPAGPSEVRKRRCSKTT